MKIRIDDSFVEYEYILSKEAEKYCINEIINNAIRKVFGKDKISIISEQIIRRED